MASLSHLSKRALGIILFGVVLTSSEISLKRCLILQSGYEESSLPPFPET